MRSSLLAFALQCLLLGYATLLYCWFRIPWPIFVGLEITGLAALVASGISVLRLRPDVARRAKLPTKLSRLSPAMLLVSMLAVLAGTIFERDTLIICSYDNALLVWLVVLIIGLASLMSSEPREQRFWRAWLVTWAMLDALIFLATAYLKDDRLAFYVALATWLIFLVLAKRWFLGSRKGICLIAVQAVNTLILMIIGLPIFDLLRSPPDQFFAVPNMAERPYSYEVARKDPAKFARWWRYNISEVNKFWPSIWAGHGAVTLRSNTVVTFYGNQIPLNSRGFRGKEFSEDKHDAYRIVALGESTTFGITMEKNDLPWPEILERGIADRLKPSQPVEVINAGIPGVSLRDNVERLGAILALHPDMIISYHGINGFGMIYEGMPAVRGKPPPAYKMRPLEILADVEYNLKVRKYRRFYESQPILHPARDLDPMDTRYARLYRQLIEIARTNNIRLVLATYSMAVNDHSPRDLVEFYTRTHMAVQRDIQANLAHNIIVRSLARENPDVTLVDTNPALDGRHEFYYDLVHFAPEGEQKMAELFLSGISNLVCSATCHTRGTTQTAKCCPGSPFTLGNLIAQP